MWIPIINIKGLIRWYDHLIFNMEISLPVRLFCGNGVWFAKCYLTHWGRVTHICVGKLAIIGSDGGLSPGRCQAITWTSAGILLIEPLGTNFSEVSIRIQTFSVKKMLLKMASAKWRPIFLGLNVLLTHWGRDKMDAISQTTLTNAFSWTKISEFRLKIHWSLFLLLTIFQHWFW